jgi:hypothetical protein
MSLLSIRNLRLSFVLLYLKPNVLSILCAEDQEPLYEILSFSKYVILLMVGYSPLS